VGGFPGLAGGAVEAPAAVEHRAPAHAHAALGTGQQHLRCAAIVELADPLVGKLRQRRRGRPGRCRCRGRCRPRERRGGWPAGAGLRAAPAFFVRYSRVKVMDEIARLVDAEAALLLADHRLRLADLRRDLAYDRLLLLKIQSQGHSPFL
jgi:hypothetical protein